MEETIIFQVHIETRKVLEFLQIGYELTMDDLAILVQDQEFMEKAASHIGDVFDGDEQSTLDISTGEVQELFRDIIDRVLPDVERKAEEWESDDEDDDIDYDDDEDEDY